MFHELIEMPGTERVFEEGAVLFSRNDVASSLMLVLSGEVRLVRHQDDGRAVVLQRASAGSVLAEASMFSDVYHCDAVAVAVSRVRIIESRRIRLKFASEPDFAAAWAAHLAHEIRNTRMRAEILGPEDGCRTARCLDRMARAAPAQGEVEACRGGDWRKSGGVLSGACQALQQAKMNMRG